MDLMAEEVVSQEAVYRGEDLEGLQNVIFKVASTAKVSVRRTQEN